jgi:hypothetical protein
VQDYAAPIKAQAMNPLYAALSRNILDVFNEYGVQIMTPNYEGDPEQCKDRAETGLVSRTGEVTRCCRFASHSFRRVR